MNNYEHYLVNDKKVLVDYFIKKINHTTIQIQLDNSVPKTPSLLFMVSQYLTKLKTLVSVLNNSKLKSKLILNMIYDIELTEIEITHNAFYMYELN